MKAIWATESQALPSDPRHGFQWVNESHRQRGISLETDEGNLAHSHLAALKTLISQVTGREGDSAGNENTAANHTGCCKIGPSSPGIALSRVPRVPAAVGRAAHTAPGSSSPLLTVSPPVQLHLQMLDNILQSLVFLFLLLVFLLPFFSGQLQVHRDCVLDGLSPGVRNEREGLSTAISISLIMFLSGQETGTGNRRTLRLSPTALLPGCVNGTADSSGSKRTFSFSSLPPVNLQIQWIFIPIVSQSHLSLFPVFSALT